MTLVADLQPPATGRPPLEPGPAAALDLLLSRRSVGLLQEPAPTEAELGLILDAGLRAPDHGRLRPWRFVLIRDAARARFAELLVAAVKRREAEPGEAMLARLRARIPAIPLLIAIGAKITTDRPTPEIEQLLSAGAAAMNMLNAIHALGYGGMWVTGANSYDPEVNAALGFTWPDRLVGLLFVGTPRAPGPEHVRPVPRPSRADHVREWTGLDTLPE